MDDERALHPRQSFDAPARPANSPSGAGTEGEIKVTLPRRLGLWMAVAIVIGNVVGSGIFRVPSTVAAETGSIGGVALVWVGGGVIALCGALALAELATAFPQAGGVYVYLREAYGPLVAFLFGWATLLTEPAAAAAVALVFAEYLGRLVRLTPLATHLVAAGAVLVVGSAGYRSVRGAGAIQGVATLAKLCGLLGLVALAFLLGDGGTGAFGAAPGVAPAARWSGVGVGFIATLWAYNGWQDLGCVAGEVHDPSRTLPRALFAGTAAVVLVYLAANAAYLYVLPLSILRTSPLVASDVAVRVLNATGGAAVAGLVMVSTFGTLNGHALVMPRVFYAMAADGVLFRPLARIHPRYGTPHVAVAFYVVFALVCLAVGTFEELIEAFVVGIWPFLALAVGAVFILRRTQPRLPRPYRTAGYPAVPILFLLATLGVVVSTLVAHPGSTLVSVGLTVLGVPAYVAWKRAGRRPSAST